MNDRNDDPAVRNYEFFCLASLLVLLLVLLQRGLGLVSLLPFLIGLGGIAGRWRYAPALLLAALLVLLTGTFAPWRSNWLEEDDPLNRTLLAAAVLGYVAGQLRLRGLTEGLFPADPRLPKPLSQPVTVERTAPGREIVLLLVSLPVWAIGAQFAWKQLPTRDYGLGFSQSGWRLVVLTWLLGLGGIVGAGLAGYANRRYRTATEAALFLQDLLWRETRGEQRRLYRWLAWRRLRNQRRKEQS